LYIHGFEEMMLIIIIHLLGLAPAGWVEMMLILLRKVLSNLIHESREAGCISESIRYRKGIIFFTLLEGPRNDSLRGRGDGDYHFDLERRLENHIRRLRRLMATR
jgi:hypothetical protein